MNRRGLLTAGAVLAGGAGWVAGSRFTRSSPADAITHQAGAKYFTNVPLMTHEGRTVRFYDDLLRGKVVMINLVFTACSDICPNTTLNLVDVQQRLGSRLGRDIFMYSISIDPERDTPQMLKAYADAFGVRHGWTFLTGDPKDIQLVRRRLGFYYLNPAEDAQRSEHIGMVRIGNEPLHRWIMGPALGNPDAIVRTVMRVIPGSTA